MKRMASIMLLACLSLAACHDQRNLLSPRPRAELSLSALPGQYQLNTHTLFYVPLDATYSSGGSTYFLELGGDPSGTDPTKDCQVVEGGDYFSVVPGKFGNALRVLGDFHKIFALFCHNTKLLNVGYNTATPDYTVGFWVKTAPSFQGFRAF